MCNKSKSLFQKRAFKLVNDFALTRKMCVCFACLLVAYLWTVLYGLCTQSFQALVYNDTLRDVMCLKPALKVTWASLLNSNNTIMIFFLMKRRTMPNKSFKRKRDREPSRIPGQRILKLLRKKMYKKNCQKSTETKCSKARIWTHGIKVTIFIASLFFNA